MKQIFALIFYFISFTSYNQVWDCEVISKVLNCDVSKNVLNQEYKVLLQINNRAGEKYTKIAIPFTKKNKINGLYAHIEDINGNIIRKLKSSDIKEKSAISDMSLYEDDFIKWFELKHNSYPYRIYYTYKISYDEFIHIARWTPVYNYLFPTHQGELNVRIPIGYEVNIFEQNISKVSVESVNSIVNYSWTENYKIPIRNEIFSPPFEELIPRVKIVAKKFRYGINGNAETWTSYGDWQYYLNKGLDKLPESEQLKVRKLTDGISDKKEIARRLYHYMQDNTRYISVQIDLGGLKTYPAEYVAINKYGDCKALSNYMMSLLNLAGIKSYYTLIYADENPVKPISDFPENQFNHVILMIPFENDTTWLECTNKNIPFGYVGSSIQNRPAFIIDKGNSHFVNTPKMGVQDNNKIRNITFDNIQFTNSDAEMMYMFKGEYFEMFNNLKSSFNKTDQEHEIRKFIPFNNFELLKWNLNKAGRDSAVIELLLNLKIAHHGTLYGKDIMFSLMPFQLPSFETPDKRKLPLKINYPYTSIDEITFKTSKFMPAKVSFKDTIMTTMFGSYSLRHDAGNEIIKVYKQFTIFSGEYALDKYPDFYKFINDIERLENNAMIIISKN